MAAGDISDALVARVRTYLDEASAGFYTDAEIFKALTDGQNEIVSHLMNMWKQKQMVNYDEPLPEVLSPVVVVSSISHGSANTYALPSDYLHYVSVAAPGGEVINIRRNSLGKVAQKANTYLKASTGADYCSIGSSILSEGTDHASITFTYIKTPADLTTDVDPVLSSSGAKVAMVQYAFADLLKKDAMFQESLQEYQKFIQMVLQLYV